MLRKQKIRTLALHLHRKRRDLAFQCIRRQLEPLICEKRMKSLGSALRLTKIANSL
jgi:hypothetical protein